jgi:chromate reductase
LPEVLVGLASEKFDESGHLTDQETRPEVRDLLVSLAAWSSRLQRYGGESVAS